MANTTRLKSVLERKAKVSHRRMHRQRVREKNEQK